MSLTFAQPFLLSDLVGLASRPVSREIDQVGYGLIGAFILVYIGLAVCYSHSHLLYLPLSLYAYGSHVCPLA